MARAADYRCEKCGYLKEVLFDGDTIPPRVHATHDTGGLRGPSACDNTEFHRVFTPVALGAGSSGGTPARPLRGAFV